VAGRDNTLTYLESFLWQPNTVSMDIKTGTKSRAESLRKNRAARRQKETIPSARDR